MKKASLIKLTLVLTVILYLTVKLTPVWSRALPPSWSTFITIISLLIGVLILIQFLYILTQIFLKSNYSKSSLLQPIIIIVLFLDLYYNPFKIDLDKFYGKVNYKAYYEGSMSGATFTLRDDNKFEIKYTSALFNQTYWKGSYTQNGDTLSLKYIGSEPPFEWGNKIIKIDGRGILVSNKNNEFNKLKKPFFWEVEETN